MTSSVPFVERRIITIKKALEKLIIMILVFTVVQIAEANADTVKIVMDTWESSTISENQILLEHYFTKNMDDGLTPEIRRVTKESDEYVSVWISGWMLYSDSNATYDVESIHLANIPEAEILFPGRMGQEARDLPKMYANKERVCLRLLIKGKEFSTENIENIISKINCSATITRYKDEKKETLDATVDFTNVHQRDFYQESNVTAKIEQCAYIGDDGISRPNVIATSKERILSSNVSYWEIAGTIISKIPIFSIHGVKYSDVIDITDFSDDSWWSISEKFVTTVIVSYDQEEPSYSDMVEILRNAKLSCTFSSEPMMEGEYGLMGPYYSIEFDLSALIEGCSI